MTLVLLNVISQQFTDSNVFLDQRSSSNIWQCLTKKCCFCLQFVFWSSKASFFGCACPTLCLSNMASDVKYLQWVVLLVSFPHMSVAEISCCWVLFFWPWNHQTPNLYFHLLWHFWSLPKIWLTVGREHPDADTNTDRQWETVEQRSIREEKKEERTT